MPNIWVMDNHKWAFFIWHKFRSQSQIDRFSLVHADHHWDGGNDFYNSPDEKQSFLAASDEVIIKLIQEELYIRFDSFIAPAIIEGMLDEVHFFCTQEDSDIGMDDKTS
jgi:hypothetical protein